MTEQVSRRTDRRLAEIADDLARTRWAVELFDSRWRLVWVSDELKVLMGEHDEERLGYGLHYAELRQRDVWRSAVTEESWNETFANDMPLVLHDTPGGKNALRPLVPKGLEDLFESMEPRESPSIWSSKFQFVRAGRPAGEAGCIYLRLRAPDGELVGTMIMYGSAIPASLQALLARGDTGMYERMAELVEPGRRRAAILFADIQASTTLSRHLSSSAYFELIRNLTTALDGVIARKKGIVGRHAGDGVTAFFLADQHGSDSEATRAAVESGQIIAGGSRAIAESTVGESGLPMDSESHVNIGLHWGGALYMGQVVTDGRLEVTALGDEVNECARIQQSARDGAILASKTLLERLTEDDALDIGIDPKSVLYTTVGELPEATEKAVRDAGGIPVTKLDTTQGQESTRR